MSLELYIAEQHDIDRETIEELLADGSDPDGMYTLEHHFFAEAFETLEKAAVEAFKLGYEVSDCESAEDEEGNSFFCFDITTEQPLELKRIQKESAAMLTFAENNGIEYDGWGTFFIGEDDEEEEGEASGE